MDHVDFTFDMSHNNNRELVPIKSPRIKQTYRGVKSTFLPKLLAISIPILIPLITFGLFGRLWSNLKEPVDTKACTCSCFDTIFKGPYETGVAKYKHIYFNSTWNSFKIWTWTVIGLVLFYECLKSFFLLTFSGHLRKSMAAIFLISLHSHIYAWWGTWGYWNDDFYSQWYHQLFFTVSEVISTTIAFQFLDSRKLILSPVPMLLIATIAVFHIWCGSLDQFVVNVIQSKGQLHQILRDIPLMLTDVGQVAIALYEIGQLQHAPAKGSDLFSITKVMYDKKNLTWVMGTSFLMYFSYTIVCSYETN